MWLFSKDSELIKFDVNYIASVDGVRDFRHTIFYIPAKNRDDAKKKMTRHLKKIGADHVEYNEVPMVVASVLEGNGATLVV